MSTLEPITRNEKFYKAIADNDSTGLPEPKTREELFLNAIATGNKEGLPEPVTRQEIFLREIAENGGGGDVTIEPLTVTENGTYSEEGKAYKPVVVDVATPENAYLLKSATDGDIVTFTDGANLPMPSLKVGIEPIQEGSGDPSPENVRPIRGWTECNLSDVSVNLFDKSKAIDGKKINSATGQILNNYTWAMSDYISVPQNTTLYTNANGTGQDYVVTLYDKEKNYIGYKSITSNASFSTDNAYFVILSTIKDKMSVDEMVLNYPATDTNYHAYNGHTYTIPFTDSQGNPITVYGGKLDVVSGVLTVDKGYIASYNGETLPSTWISDRDVYVEGTSPTTGAQVVYELATPITYQFNPTAVKSLLGNNNVWCDTGDIEELEYFSKEG